MKNTFKLKLLAAAVLMASGVAQAGIANVSGNGTIANPYQMGVVGPTVNVLAATIFGSPSSSFEEYANFTIPTASTTSGSANTYTLNFAGLNVLEITGLTVEVWNDVHPNGSTLFATFSGNNATTLIGNLAAGQYHLDISGNFGSTAQMGQYSVALQALPVPEPETYAMLLAGLGLIGFMARRRKIA